MTQGNIIKQLSKGLGLTFLISVLFMFLAVEGFYSLTSKSLAGGRGPIVMAIPGFFWTLILTLFSATVFLNLYPPIRNNAFNCFLSFYLSPFVFSTTVAIDKVAVDVLPDFMIITLPFFFVHSCFFIRFKSAVFVR